MTEKLTLDGEKLFVLRSTKTAPDGSVSVSYYESQSMWNRSPLNATIFTDYDAGLHHQYYVHNKRAPKGWADGSVEVFDVVPLIGEIKLSPNGVSIAPKPKEPS